MQLPKKIRHLVEDLVDLHFCKVWIVMQMIMNLVCRNIFFERKSEIVCRNILAHAYIIEKN